MKRLEHAPSPSRSSRRAGLASLILGAGLLGITLGSAATAAPPKGGGLVRPEPAPLRLGDEVTWTAVSGETGSTEKVIGPRNRRRAATAVMWWENKDNPCRFRVDGELLNDSSDRHAFKKEHECRGGVGDKKAVSRPADGEFITAVEVCLTDKKKSSRDKLKGIRLWGRILDRETRTLGPENGPAEDHHAHCNDGWTEKVSCPAGQVAQQVKVYFNRRPYKPGYARGISLGCRAIE